MSQTLDSIHHRLNHECEMAADLHVDMVAHMDVDMVVAMAIDMDVDMADDVDTDNPCFHGPIASGPNIFGLLII
jgi:hypothetical protein